MLTFKTPSYVNAPSSPSHASPSLFTTCMLAFNVSPSLDCPVWQKEKEIQKVRTEQKISFPEARKIVEGKNNISTRSFASAAARKVVSVGCQTDPIVIMPPTGATVSAITLTNPQIQKNLEYKKQQMSLQ